MANNNPTGINQYTKGRGGVKLPTAKERFLAVRKEQRKMSPSARKRMADELRIIRKLPRPPK